MIRQSLSLVISQKKKDLAESFFTIYASKSPADMNSHLSSFVRKLRVDGGATYYEKAVYDEMLHDLLTKYHRDISTPAFLAVLQVCMADRDFFRTLIASDYAIRSGMISRLETKCAPELLELVADNRSRLDSNSTLDYRVLVEKVLVHLYVRYDEGKMEQEEKEFALQAISRFNSLFAELEFGLVKDLEGWLKKDLAVK